MQPSIKLIKFDTRETIIKTLYETYMITKRHIPVSEVVYDHEEAERLYKEYFTHCNPLMEYNHFIVECHGFSRDFLAHISRDTKFLRMWVGSNRVSPDGQGFVDKDQYYTPMTIRKNEAKSEKYLEYLTGIQGMMMEAARDGWSTEEIKAIMPHGISIPITFSGSFRAIKSMCVKRACLHAQDHWQEFIHLLGEEFRKEVDPWLADMLYRPSCMDTKKCAVKMEQDARTRKWDDTGIWKDPLEICPLYTRFERKSEMKELDAMAADKHPERGIMVDKFYEFIRDKQI